MKNNEFELLKGWLEKANYFFTHDKNFEEIPEEELISLKDLVTLIQIVYSKFKEEYSDLEKLNIGENNNVIYYKNDDSRLLYMQINEQTEKTIVPKGFHYLTISDFKGNPRLYFQNTEIMCDERKIVSVDSIDSKILNGYLDLFGKYYPIFKLYVDLHRTDFLASNRNQHLMMGMDTTNDSLINGLNGIIFYIQQFCEMGDNFIIKLYVDLKNGINIDYKKSEIIVNDSVKKPNGYGFKEILDHAFESIRFNFASIEKSGIIEFARSIESSEQKTSGI